MAKILIVDDETHIQLLLQQTLEDLEDKGVDIFTASNGKEALGIIQAEKPNLIFLDVMMPEMDGFEVCKAVKKDMGLSDIYIIILTAKGQEYDKNKGKEVGADLYMSKPFDPDAIVAKAAEILGIQM